MEEMRTWGSGSLGPPLVHEVLGITVFLWGDPKCCMISSRPYSIYLRGTISPKP